MAGEAGGIVGAGGAGCGAVDALSLAGIWVGVALASLDALGVLHVVVDVAGEAVVFIEGAG